MQTITIAYSIGAVVIAAVIAIFHYYYKTKKRTKNLVLFSFLRFVTILSVLLLLINPKFEQTTYYNEKPILTIAVDNSSSINELGYAEQVSQLVNSLQNNSTLQDKFEIETYTFSDRLHTSDSLTFTNQQTNIEKALRDANELYKNTIAPTILITDGNQTYGNDYQFLSSKIKQPVFPIMVGDTVKYADLKITQLNANKYAYLKNKFLVEIIATYSGQETLETNVTLSSNGKRLASKKVRFSPTENSQVITFTIAATQIGVQTMTANLQPLPAEKNTANNQRYFAVEVIDQKVKIAVISELLHPDLGTLKKSLESNELRSVDLLKPTAALNGLNDYQLIVFYQPTTAFQTIMEKANTLQKNELYITGTQTDWRFLNEIQSNFNRKYTSETEEVQGNLNTNYTNFIIENIDFSNYPPLENTFGDLTFNTAHDVILYQVVSGVSTEIPLLATYTYDNRRAAIIAGENLWKWRAHSFLEQNNFQQFDTFLGKLTQYLASTKKRERLTISYESFYYGNNEIQLSAQYFNPSFEFDANANLIATIKNSETEEITRFPMLLNSGYYAVDLSNLAPGSYTFTVKAEGQNIQKSGKFEILAFDIEKQFLSADTARLQAVAQQSDGKAFHISENPETLVNELQNDTRFQTIEKSNKNTVSLIDWKYLLALIALCLSIEWFLRKYYGLI